MPNHQYGSIKKYSGFSKHLSVAQDYKVKPYENDKTKGISELASRGSSNKTVHQPNGTLPLANPEPEPNQITSELPEDFFEIGAEFVARFKRGDWSPRLTDLSGSVPTRRALVIAINYEGGDSRVKPLSGVYTDARKIIHVLETKLKYLPDEICVLADIREPFSDEQERSRWPSRENIYQAIRWLTVGTAAEHYRFLFGCHGHRQIRAQTVDGTPALISNEGILLREDGFIPFNRCDDCQCQDRERFQETYQEIMCAEDGSKYIPQPQKVLYDYDLNDQLAQSLGPGAKLTCCYSGGTLNSLTIPPETLPQNVDATSQARGGSPFYPTGPQPISQLNKEQFSKPFGNILCLPVQVEIPTPRGRLSIPSLSVSAAETSPFITSCYSLPNIPAGRYGFRGTCEIFCAAPHERENERAWEQYGRGRFSLAFTEMFEASHLPTYRELNGCIQAEFEAYNRHVEKVWDEQHPQLFVSSNLAKDKECRLDTSVTKGVTFDTFLGRRSANTKIRDNEARLVAISGSRGLGDPTTTHPYQGRTEQASTMSDYPDSADLPLLQPRGAPNQTVSGPKKVLPQPAPSPQPEASP
ncbi:hypothetical protein BDV93DRAFT_590548, partial [Ceratobasidium sp. AG-I]